MGNTGRVISLADERQRRRDARSSSIAKRYRDLLTDWWGPDMALQMLADENCLPVSFILHLLTLEEIGV